MRDIIVSPSLLAADFANLDKEIKKVEDSKAKWLHFDVMDGHFVPNISFGSKVLSDVCRVSNLFMDVHLMISDPLLYAESFVKAGADLITFHYEVFNSHHEAIDAINKIRNLGVQVGVSIKPSTDVESILPLVKHLDLVLVMSVEPGFGGQKFMESGVSKIRTLREYIDKHNISCLIEVDGGIDEITGKRCKDAGADVLVAGSYLFGHRDMALRIEGLLTK